jgi:hypothetical protein
MGLFGEMYGNRQFPSDLEYRELRRTLSEAIAGGSVERIPVIKRNRVFPSEQWFRDKETGEIYSLIRPEERIRGRWAKVDLEKYS